MLAVTPLFALLMAAATSAMEFEAAVTEVVVPSEFLMVSAGGVVDQDVFAAVTVIWRCAVWSTVKVTLPGAALLRAVAVTPAALLAVLYTASEGAPAAVFALAAMDATAVFSARRSVTNDWVVLRVVLSAVCGCVSIAISCVMIDVVSSPLASPSMPSP